MGWERIIFVVNNGLEMLYFVIVILIEIRDNWENKINVKFDIVNKYNIM